MTSQIMDNIAVDVPKDGGNKERADGVAPERRRSSAVSDAEYQHALEV